MGSGGPWRSGTVHPAFTRPGVLAFAALAGGIALGYGAGLGAWQPGAALACGAVAALVLSKAESLTRPAAFALLFLGAGLALASFPQSRTAASATILDEFLPGGSPLVAAEGPVAAFPRRSASGWTVLLGPGVRIEAGGRAAEIPGRIALRTGDDPDTNRLLLDTVPGDTLRAAGPLTPLARPQARGEFQDWLAGREAVAVVRSRSAQMVSAPQDRTRWESFLALGLRAGNEAEARIVRALPEREAALLVAMTLGRTYRLDTAQRDGFRRAGLVHIFAVSGLHTMLVGGMALWLLRLFGLPPGVRVGVLAGLLLFFAVVVGLRMSVLRAALLLLAFESKELLRRPVEPLSALGTAGTLLLLLDPISLWQPDFQLTFLCAATLILFGPWSVALDMAVGERLGWTWKATLTAWTARVALVSAVIQLALIPVLVNGFGEASLIVPVTNVLLLFPAVLSIQVAFAFQFLGLFVPGAAGPLLGALEWPLRIIGAGCEFLGGLPFAAFASTPWPVWLCLLYYLLLLAGPWNRFRRVVQPRRTPWQFVPAPMALALLLLWTPALLDRGPRGLEVWWLDVGQGDAVLIRAPCGAAALFDAGPPQRGWYLPEMLRRRGVSEVDLLIASHADADHIGGMPDLIREMPVGQLAVGGSLAATAIFRELEETVRQHQVPVATVRRGSQLRLGRDRILIDVLHPTEEWAGEDLSRNDASIVLRLTYAGRTVILPGDAEFDAELSMIRSEIPLRADVLMAGHHGSRWSTHELFLAEVRPGYVTISCGRNNRYGHPTPEVLARVAEIGATVYRTDRDGSIRLRISPSGEMHWSTTHQHAPLLE